MGSEMCIRDRSQLFASRTKVLPSGRSLFSDMVLIQFFPGESRSRSKRSPKASFDLRLALYLLWTMSQNRAFPATPASRWFVVPGLSYAWTSGARNSSRYETVCFSTVSTETGRLFRCLQIKASPKKARPFLAGLIVLQVSLRCAQAICNGFAPKRLRRRIATPAAPKPTSIIAQVPGSGTAPTASSRICPTS